ncbi:MAG: transposase [Ruminiclostridium sp.]|nr:transposase [Ruminiclostridium sp.]
MERKLLRLEGYDYASRGAYFITVCTEGKRSILGSVVGGDDHIGPCVALTQYGRIVEKYLCRIPGVTEYIIMPNHVHMIVVVQPEESGPMRASAPTISQHIRAFKGLATKEAGVSLWQRSFYDHVIRDEDDYLRIVEYILENPAKWMEDRYYVPES